MFYAVITKNDSISYYNFSWNKLKICILSKYKEAIKKQMETVNEIFSNEFSKTTKFQKQRIFKTRWMSSIVEKRWEVRISALEDRTIEFILSKQQRETKVLGSCEKIIKDLTFISLESQKESTEKWS